MATQFESRHFTYGETVALQVDCRDTDGAVLTDPQAHSYELVIGPKGGAALLTVRDTDGNFSRAENVATFALSPASYQGVLAHGQEYQIAVFTTGPAGNRLCQVNGKITLASSVGA